MGRGDRLAHNHPGGESATGLGARRVSHTAFLPLRRRGSRGWQGKLVGLRPRGPQKGSAQSPKERAHRRTHAKGAGTRTDTVTRAAAAGRLKVHSSLPRRALGSTRPREGARPARTPRQRRRPGARGGARSGLGRRGSRRVHGVYGEAGRGRRSGGESGARSRRGLIRGLRADPSSSVARRRRTARPGGGGAGAARAGGGAGPRGRGRRGAGAPGARCAAPPEHRPRRASGRLCPRRASGAGAREGARLAAARAPGLCAREGGLVSGARGVPGARRAASGRSCGGGSTWRPLGPGEGEVGRPTRGRRPEH